MSDALRQLHDAANALADSGLRTIKTNNLCVAVYGAIDELERLNAENERLWEALKKIATIQGGGDCCSVYECFVYAKRISRAALAEKEKK